MFEVKGVRDLVKALKWRLIYPRIQRLDDYEARI